MKRTVLLLAFVLILSLTACGGESAPSGGEGSSAGGNIAAGQTVFETAAPACGTCHSLEAGKALTGPSLAKIGAEAGSRVPGQSAEDYLRESVVDPNAHVVDGFAANVMPATYAVQLNEQQLADLVAYLISLK